MLELEQWKSLNDRFPYPFIHINLWNPFHFKTDLTSARRELLTSSDEAGLKTDLSQLLQLLSTNLLLSVNFCY